VCACTSNSRSAADGASAGSAGDVSAAIAGSNGHAAGSHAAGSHAAGSHAAGSHAAGSHAAGSHAAGSHAAGAGEGGRPGDDSGRGGAGGESSPAGAAGAGDGGWLGGDGGTAADAGDDSSGSGPIARGGEGGSGAVPSDAGGVGGTPASAGSSGGPAATGGFAGSSGYPSGLRDGCVLLLHMDEAKWTNDPGSVVDDSGAQNHGTTTGSIQTTANGRFGRAGLFDGSGWISVADSASLHASTELTISAWILPAELNASFWPGIVTKRRGFGSEVSFSLHIGDTDRLTVDIAGEDDRFRSDMPLSTQRWQHVAIVYDAALPPAERVKLYFDGTLRQTAAESSDSIPAYASPLLVGSLPDGGSVYVGRIDEVGLWVRALGSDEIAFLSKNAIP
jgi:hypothetical protein